MTQPEHVKVRKHDVGGGGKHMPERACLSLTKTTCIGKRTEAEAVEHKQNNPTDHARTIAEYLPLAKT